MKKNILFLLILIVSAIHVSHAQRLKLMSYNIYHGEESYDTGKSNLQRIAAIINHEKPDVVLLQEVDSMTQRSATFNNGKPVSLVQELAALTGMKGYFAKAIDYSGGGYGEGLLINSNAAINRYTLPIPEGGEVRSMITATIPGKKGKKIIIGGTHLCHESEKNRSAQVNEINKIFELVDYPVIIAGDFNFEPDSAPYQLMNTHFLDAAAKAGNLAETFSWDKPEKRIDYFFIGKKKMKKVKIKSYNILQENPSDHLPILLEIKW